MIPYYGENHPKQDESRCGKSLDSGFYEETDNVYHIENIRLPHSFTSGTKISPSGINSATLRL